MDSEHCLLVALCLAKLVWHWVNRRSPGEAAVRDSVSHAPWRLILLFQFIQVLENSIREQDNKNRRSVNMAASFPSHPLYELPVTGCRILLGTPEMRLHKRWCRGWARGKSFYSTSVQAAQESGHCCHDWATEFHILVASWESLAVMRPLCETGLWAADTGRQGKCRLFRTPYCWGGMSHSVGTGGEQPGKEGRPASMPVVSQPSL